MEKDLAARIASHPKYQELKAKRTRFGWWLTALMMVVYYGFILLVALAPALLDLRLDRRRRRADRDELLGQALGCRPRRFDGLGGDGADLVHLAVDLAADRVGDRRAAGLGE